MTRLILILAAQIILLAALSSAGDVEDLAITISQKLLSLHRKEKLTHLRFYLHDTINGPNPSSIQIKQPVSNDSSFGMITIMDDPLTVNESRNSAVVGQAQGIYVGTAQGGYSLLMGMNFVFKTGTYNGSTIAILGRNPIFSMVREMPIIGGTGIFRFARGYIKTRTILFDRKSLVVIAEYNCYILHPASDNIESGQATTDI